MEAHDFSKGLDINSLKGGKRGGRKMSCNKTLKDSFISIRVTTLRSDKEEEEEESKEDEGFGDSSMFYKSMEESKVGEVKN